MTLRALIPVLLIMPSLPALAEPRVEVCWDYGCDERARIELPTADWQRIRDLFATRAPDASSERARIARAIAQFEGATGRVLGTDADLGGNRAGSGRAFQMDCIDESLNTDTYLRVLEAHGLLDWHYVSDRRKRAPWIFDQHWTAVVREKESRRLWVVDSWFLDNGKQPYIQPLAAWLEKAELPFNPDATADDG